MIETDRRTNRRAYFFGERGPRLLVYDTPVRRGVEREVVKQRGERPRVWFENEGIAYEIARLGSLWGVRVKPFYMFTGPDAQTPLPGYARTAKATRRMKYDRDQSVESDLTFGPGSFLRARLCSTSDKDRSRIFCLKALLYLSTFQRKV